MSERTTIGGIVYESIGSSSSNLLLKCNGTARIQWGNKLIDLIKNGKLATEEQTSQFTRGMIIMYSGTESIPEGWAICDGNTYSYKGVSSQTPNLINKFIKAVATASNSNEYITTQESSEPNCFSLIFIMKL